MPDMPATGFMEDSHLSGLHAADTLDRAVCRWQCRADAQVASCRATCGVYLSYNIQPKQTVPQNSCCINWQSTDKMDD